MDLARILNPIESGEAAESVTRGRPRHSQSSRLCPKNVAAVECKAPRRQQGNRLLPIEAVCILYEWLYSHVDCPYPSRQKLSRLTSLTGLARVQVQNFLVNGRRRKLNLRGKSPGSVMRLSDHG